ncbi:peptidylprolyl isomerase [Desulfatitalea alkaliphila]|uniref:Peptidylprolyl isomerase n=1 Tax=Desulfatitalea alkaliphila TaxID=2929485 RepID=A0AA41R263_9BACT|nr:peptidylprolyl isomerase [Desulfatitalea alkaliphila]MCJ8499915.1 peptidylprolyl isomerase [Desulfatitalea alkaliphila]
MPSHPKLYAPAALFALLLLLHGFFPATAALAQSDSAAPLAKVNEAVVTEQMLTQELHLLQLEMAQRQASLGTGALRELRRTVLQDLIDRELLRQEAQARNIVVRQQWVQDALMELQQRMGGQQSFASALAAADITRRQMTERLQQAVAVRLLLQQEPLKGVRVSETEIRAYYDDHQERFGGADTYRLRHLMVALSGTADDARDAAALQHIEQLAARIDSGTPLAVLALDHSDCPSRGRGGDLGYLTADQMPTAFARAIADLPPGQISAPLRTDEGYHLIELIDRRVARPIPYHQVRAKIERTLRIKKEHDAVQAYLTRIKQQAEVLQ